MAKCSKCRNCDTNPLLGDLVSCITCGHTGVPAAPTPPPVEKAKAKAEEE